MKTHFPFRPLLAAALLGVLAPPLLRAHSWVEYDAGEIDTASYNTSTADLALAMWGGGSAEQRGVLYGPDGITKRGVGTIALTAANTYTGVTTISDGTLQIGVGGTSGSILGHVVNNATLAFNRSDALTYGGDMSGSGSLIQRGSGVLTLTGSISLGAVTWISSGTLRIGNGGTSGSILGGIANDGALIFERSDASAYTGTLGGSGTVTKAGAGTLTLTGTNHYTGATSITGGLINFSSMANFGASTLTIDGGGLQWASGNSTDISSRLAAFGAAGATFDTNGNNVAFSSALSGSGALKKTGAGTLTLSGVNTYSGGTRVTGGLIQFGSLSNFGTGAITLDGAGLQWAAASTTDVSSRLAALGSSGATFDTNGNNVVFASALSGSGPLTKTGSGSLTLAAASTYPGNTVVNAGTLVLANTTLSPAFSIASGAALDLSVASGTRNNPAATTFTGTGTLVKTGAGILRWDSAVATFALGAGSLIDVQAGTLVAGSFGNDVWTDNLSNLNVAAGATFTGSQANVRVAALTGSGLIRSGYNGAGYTAFTFGLNDASGTFSGELADYIYPEGHTGAGHFVKVGTGTQALTGASTYSGTTTVTGGFINFTSMASFGTSTITLDGGGLQWASGTSTDISSRLAAFGTAGATFDTNGNNVAFSAALSGPGALNKIGAGTLALYGANTHSGRTIVSAGTLRAGAGSLSSTTGGISVHNGATLDLDGAVHAVTGLSSAGDRIVGNLANGTLTLNEDLYYQSGTTTATLQGTGRLLIGGDAGSTVILNGTNDMVALDGQSQVVIGGPGDVVINSNMFGLADTVKLGNAHALAAANSRVEVNSGTLDLNGQTDVRALAINLGYTYLSPENQTRLGSLVNNDAVHAASFGGSVSLVDEHVVGGAGSLTLGGELSGWGYLNKVGSGTLTLAGPVTYRGGAFLSEGTLAIAAADTLNREFYFYGGTLRYLSGGTGDHSAGFIGIENIPFRIDTNGHDVTFVTALTRGRAFYKFGDGKITLTAASTHMQDGIGIYGGTLALRGGHDRLPTNSPIYMENSTLDLGAFNQTAPSVIAYDANIAGTGTLAVTEGTSEIIRSTITANLAGTGEFLVADATFNGTNTYSGSTTIYQTLRIGAGGETGTLGTGDVVITDFSHLLFDRSNAITVDNAISGAGSLTQAGSGTLLLSGANTFTGGLTLNAGTLDASSNTNLGATTGAVTFGGGTLRATADFTSSRATTLNSGGGAFDVVTGATLTWNGAIGGAAGNALTKSGAGTLLLGGSNTFAGGLILNAGTVQVGSSNALSTGTAVTLAGGATLDLNTHPTTVARLEGTGGTVALIGATLSVAQSSDSTFSGALTGTGGLVKSGAGTLALSGTSNHTGATTITAGHLKLTGSATGSAFTVHTAGLLSGNGSIGALTIGSGGILSPGNSPGLLSATGNTMFAGGGSLLWEINRATGGTAGATSGSGWDLLSISGALSITATSADRFTIDLTSLTLLNTAGQAAHFNSASNYTFDFVTATGGISGFDTNAFTIDTSAFSNAFTGTWSVTASANTLSLNYTASAIPEPSTYAALAGLTVLALAASRRRRNG